MNRVRIYKDIYPVSLTKIKSAVNNTLISQKINGDVEVSINFVDDKIMSDLHRKYLHEEGTTDVLSFPVNEIKAQKNIKKSGAIVNGYIQLGDIVISFDQANRQAKKLGHTTSEEIDKLVEHGVLHLLGIHHE